MATHNEQYLVNADGDKVGVVLSVEEYERLLAALEELDSIKAYDAAKASGEKPISFEQAVQDIDQSR
jgi:PHD/YefM family antitoxin component YafN of YafNO toxin-antitoxin module